MVVTLCLSPLTSTPLNAQTNDSDAIFVEAVAAVKNKDYGRAVKLFSSQAEANQHDAQYNLAVLLKAGKGAPQDFLKALTWAWAAHLGGIEAAEDLSDELLDLIPEKSIEAAREAVAKRLRARIDDPSFSLYGHRYAWDHAMDKSTTPPCPLTQLPPSL